MILLYSSNTSDLGLQGLAIALSQNYGQPVEVLPLSMLPSPDLEHLNRLRVERAEVVEQLNQVEWSLEQFKSGAWQPDAGMQNGLEFERQALLNRRDAINRTLGAEKGAVSNG